MRTGCPLLTFDNEIPNICHAFVEALGVAALIDVVRDVNAKVDVVFLEALGVDSDNLVIVKKPAEEAMDIAVLLIESREVDLVVYDSIAMTLPKRVSEKDIEKDTMGIEAKRNNLFIIRSLTKFFALPGIRIGYGVGHTDLLKRMKIHKEYWSVNILAQVAGMAALKDKEYIKRTQGLISKERKFLYNKLSRIKGLKQVRDIFNKTKGILGEERD